jgi:hypothetical protein
MGTYEWEFMNENFPPKFPAKNFGAKITVSRQKFKDKNSILENLVVIHFGRWRMWYSHDTS